MHADDDTDYRFEMALDALRQTLNPLHDAYNLLECNCGTVCEQTCSRALSEAAYSRAYNFIRTWEINSRMDRLWEQMRSFAATLLALPASLPSSRSPNALEYIVTEIRQYHPYKDFESQLRINLDSVHQARRQLEQEVNCLTDHHPAEACILVLVLHNHRHLPQVQALLLEMGGLRGTQYLEPAFSLAHMLNEQIAPTTLPNVPSPASVDHTADFEASMKMLDGLDIPRTTAEGQPISLAVRITLLHKKNAEGTDYVDPLSGRAFTSLEQRMR